LDKAVETKTGERENRVRYSNERNGTELMDGIVPNQQVILTVVVRIQSSIVPATVAPLIVLLF
jgi:hypothetical protein